MSRRFEDRTDAGRQLARSLIHLHGRDVLVLGLPRGGVPVAIEVARALNAQFDILNVRKLGVPWRDELAMGAIGANDIRVLNNDVIMSMGITTEDVEEATTLQRMELERRELVYRGGRPAPKIRGRSVVIVDDGIATGATMRAAVAVVRAQQPREIIVAAPVVQRSVASDLAREVDQVIAVIAPADLFSVSVWYVHFPQLRDRDVESFAARLLPELELRK